jgi:hypothetical protein
MSSQKSKPNSFASRWAYTLDRGTRFLEALIREGETDGFETH